MKRSLSVLIWAMGVLASLCGMARAEAAYTINPGDVLQITVWKEDGMDREVLVLPDGSLQYPLVGTLMAAGKTVPDLQKEVVDKLTHYMPDASVTVAVKAALGHSVSVIGQVNKPGELILGHRTTVMQALSIAGGLTPYASHSDIIILRHDGGKETAVPFAYDEVIRGRSLEQNVVLTPGDVIVVPNATLF